MYTIFLQKAKVYVYFLPLSTQLLIMIQSTFLALGSQEVIIIAILILLIFGGRKIPELMRGLGRGVREFNDAKTNVKKELEETSSDIIKP